MMPSMTAGLNAVPLHLMSRGSAMSNVMRQVFGAFGTALVVTILQQRQTYHTAMLAQSVTPDNLPLQQLMSTAQQWGLTQGMSAVQAQAMATMVAVKQVALAAAVMGFDDVFRVTAVITLLAIPPALFMRTTRAPAGRGPTVIAD
jgi:uncharacterized membrane protein YkvI